MDGWLSKMDECICKWMNVLCKWINDYFTGLPTTKLGSFLEERVNTFLRQAGTDAEVTIRVVSSSNKFLDTRLGMTTPII